MFTGQQYLKFGYNSLKFIYKGQLYEPYFFPGVIFS